MEVSEQDKLTFRLLSSLMQKGESAVQMCFNEDFLNLVGYFIKKYKNREDLIAAIKQYKD